MHRALPSPIELRQRLPRCDKDGHRAFFDYIGLLRFGPIPRGARRTRLELG